MPSHEEHCRDSLSKYGKRFDDLHSWMDEPREIPGVGRYHREFRHDPYTTPLEARKLFGEYADHACLDHIRLDQLASEKIKAKTMDADFCVHWKGNEKARWCRCCEFGIKEGQPCFDLWKAVKRLAAKPLTFTNTRKGKASGHRYRLECPSGDICYLKMLQDKESRFALPKEDFLYVTKTGRGGINETPSKTRQNPFVDLLLELIWDSPDISEGSRVIKEVIAIPTKHESPEEHGSSKLGETAGICPKCGSPLVWRKAELTGELYRGCTNYDGGCRYHERSYRRTPKGLKQQKDDDLSGIEPYDDIDQTSLGPDDSHFYGSPLKRKEEKTEDK